jgi:hypothetical protein
MFPYLQQPQQLKEAYCNHSPLNAALRTVVFFEQGGKNNQ